MVSQSAVKVKVVPTVCAGTRCRDRRRAGGRRPEARPTRPAAITSTAPSLRPSLMTPSSVGDRRTTWTTVQRLDLGYQRNARPTAGAATHRPALECFVMRPQAVTAQDETRDGVCCLLLEGRVHV